MCPVLGANLVIQATLYWAEGTLLIFKMNLVNHKLMKQFQPARFLVVLCSLAAMSTGALAQQAAATAKIEAEKATVSGYSTVPDAYLIEVAGQDGMYWRYETEGTQAIEVSNRKADGSLLQDGLYTVQVTPIIKLAEAQRAALARLRTEADADSKIAEFREANGLPAEVSSLSMYLRVQEGAFVLPEEEVEAERWASVPEKSSAWHQDYPSLYAAIRKVSAQKGPRAVMASYNDLPLDNSPLSEDAQVFVTDLIVQGSACVGVDCNSNENFGFTTFRLKENNLRITFTDTSNSGSFPSNDWQLTANDSSNGGQNYFGIEDVTGGNTPFRVVAGAGNNALYIDAQGDVGLNTSTPVLELHIADGDSPGLRLEQTGQSGWTPQTWDVAGNEANFFVRDVTNSSKIPFKIKPNAPTNALFVNTEGNIGLGTGSPTHKAQIESGNLYVKSGSIGVNTEPTVALDVIGNSKLQGPTFVSNSFTQTGNVTSGFYTQFFQPIMVIDGANQHVGIGTGNPLHQLQLSEDDAVKPNGGDWMGASDRRLKKDIKPFTDGLEQVLRIRPVRYHYNGTLGLPTEPEFIGVIAQDMKEVAPYTVKPLHPNGQDDYLAYDGTAVSYLLVNAVQEQQQIIEAQAARIQELEARADEIDELKAQLEALARLVQQQADKK